jgi:hypothetical protein
MAKIDVDAVAAVVNDNGKVRFFSKGLGAESDCSAALRRLGGHLKGDKYGKLHLVTGEAAKKAIEKGRL